MKLFAFIFAALVTMTLCDLSEAQVSAAEDRASQFVTGDAKQSETFDRSNGIMLLVAGSLAIAGALAALLLSSRHYSTTNLAIEAISKHIENEENKS